MSNVIIYAENDLGTYSPCRIEDGKLQIGGDIVIDNTTSLKVDINPNGTIPDVHLSNSSISNEGFKIKAGNSNDYINATSNRLHVDTNLDLSTLATESTLTDIKNKTNLLNSYGGLFPNSIQVGVVNPDNRSYTYNGDGSSQISSTLNNVSNKMGLDVFVSNKDDININCTNQITGYALESGNLSTIATNTNKIHSDTVNTDAIQVQVKNTSIDTHCMGYDPDATTYNNIYCDVDGVQRVEVVEPHIVSAKYIIETDATIIAKLHNSTTDSNAYSIDARGRDGWYYQNLCPTPGTASGANVLNWYKNNLSVPPDLTIQKLQALYAVVCFDLLPTNAFHSYFIVSSASSVWFFYNSISQISQIYPGETYLLYYGQKAYQHFPEIQNGCKLEMTKGLISGPGANNEIITSIEFFNSDETALNVYKYLINECGLYDQDRANWFQVYFRNSIDFDANNNLSNLTFTSNNVNVNVSNTVGVSGSVSISGTPTVSISGTPTVSISGTPSVNANITNSSIAVSGSVSISGTPNVNISNTPNVNAYITNSSIPVSGTVIIGSALSNSIAIGAYDTSTLTNDFLTLTKTGVSTVNLDTYINNGSTTNNYSKTGISTYNIYPKKRTLAFGGNHTTAVANGVLGAPANAISVSTYFGYLGSPMTHYIYLTAASGNGRVFYYSYVSSTDLSIKEGSITLSLNTWQTLAETDIACIRDYRGITTAIGATENLRIGIISGSNNYCYCYLDRTTGWLNGVYICPANTVATIQNMSFFANSGTDLSLYKFSEGASGLQVGRTIYRYFNASNFTQNSGGNGALGDTIIAGERVYWYCLNATPSDKRINFTITEYYDL